jgi:hypothetical protein
MRGVRKFKTKASPNKLHKQKERAGANLERACIFAKNALP